MGARNLRWRHPWVRGIALFSWALLVIPGTDALAIKPQPHGDDWHAASNGDTHFLVRPIAVVEVRAEQCDQCIHAEQSPLNLPLPFLRWLNVFVSDECRYPTADE